MAARRPNPAVDDYLEHAPAEQVQLLRRIRALIRKHLPLAEEAMESNMPVYKVNGAWAAGFAARAKGPMLYVMHAEVLDGFAGRLGKARSGKSCVDLKVTKTAPADHWLVLADEILRELARHISVHADSPN